MSRCWLPVRLVHAPARKESRRAFDPTAAGPFTRPALTSRNSTGAIRIERSVGPLCAHPAEARAQTRTRRIGPERSSMRDEEDVAYLHLRELESSLA